MDAAQRARALALVAYEVGLVEQVSGQEAGDPAVEKEPRTKAGEAIALQRREARRIGRGKVIGHRRHGQRHEDAAGVAVARQGEAGRGCVGPQPGMVTAVFRDRPAIELAIGRQGVPVARMVAGKAQIAQGQRIGQPLTHPQLAVEPFAGGQGCRQWGRRCGQMPDALADQPDGVAIGQADGLAHEQPERRRGAVDCHQRASGRRRGGRQADGHIVQLAPGVPPQGRAGCLHRHLVLMREETHTLRDGEIRRQRRRAQPDRRRAVDAHGAAGHTGHTGLFDGSDCQQQLQLLGGEGEAQQIGRGHRCVGGDLEQEGVLRQVGLEHAQRRAGQGRTDAQSV